jgi:kumamolisin
MLLNSEKVFVAIMLMISAAGTAQAQVSNNVTSPSPPGLAIPDLKVTPQRKQTEGGHVVIPESSIPKSGDAGVRMHTNIEIFVPNEQPQGQPQAAVVSPNVVGPPFPGFFFETPASLACIYDLVTVTPGCDPNKVKTVSTRGSKVVAIVDAFHDSSALADLQLYSTQFGLPASNLQVVFATGVQPPVDPTFGWEVEESLDMQMVHALAPHAKIILVEAASNSGTDLLQAEDVASKLVAAAGGGEVSNSWGGGEFAGESSFDSHFSKTGVVYLASTGDSPGVEWPSTSANVVAAGGTSTSRSPITGAFFVESTWSQAGGGVSAFVARPAYQNKISAIIGGHRGVPDISADANPDTGVWVTCGVGCGNPPGAWYIVGGTSVASPSVAAMVNGAGRFASSSASELTTVYGNNGTTKFNDIIMPHGLCGPYAGFLPQVGWDFCTGVGSPHGISGL